MEQPNYGHSSRAVVKSCGLGRKSWVWSRLKILSCTIFEWLFLTQTDLLIWETFRQICFEIKRPGTGSSSSRLCYWTNGVWKHALAYNSEAKTRDGSVGWGYRSLDGSHPTQPDLVWNLVLLSSNPVVWLCLRADMISEIKWFGKMGGMERGLLSSLHRWDCWNSGLLVWNPRLPLWASGVVQVLVSRLLGMFPSPLKPVKRLSWHWWALAVAKSWLQDHTVLRLH